MSALPALRASYRLVDSVHAALRAAILEGSLAPGQALSVPELSRQLDVSRSPVREAVLALVADGLAIEQPRRGATVVEIGAADMLEIHEVREALEAQAARLCAARADASVLHQLSASLLRQAATVERGDASGWFQTNADFHRLIAAGAGNRRLSTIVSRLEQQMQLGLRQVAAEQAQHRRGLSEHRAIADAIMARDPDGAERSMREHIRQTRQLLSVQLGASARSDERA